MPTQQQGRVVLSDGDVHYINLMAKLNLPVWLRFNELTGTVVKNYGTLGSAEDGTWSPGVGALGQTDALGSNEAYLYDNANSLTTVPSNAAINGLAAATYMFLIRATSAGETSKANFYDVNSNTELLSINSVSLDLKMVFPSTTSPITTITNTGFIALATDTLLFFTYDYGSDKIGRIYKGVGGVVTEATYATQTAGVGTRAASAFTKNIGNAAALSRTHDGLLGEFAIAPYVMPLSLMTSIAKAINRGSP